MDVCSGYWETGGFGHSYIKIRCSFLNSGLAEISQLCYVLPTATLWCNTNRKVELLMSAVTDEKCIGILLVLNACMRKAYGLGSNLFGVMRVSGTTDGWRGWKKTGDLWSLSQHKALHGEKLLKMMMVSASSESCGRGRNNGFLCHFLIMGVSLLQLSPALFLFAPHLLLFLFVKWQAGGLSGLVLQHGFELLGN